MRKNRAQGSKEDERLLHEDEDREDRESRVRERYEESNVLALEIGYRAWTWAQDVNPYESNDEDEVCGMIAGLEVDE